MYYGEGDKKAGTKRVEQCEVEKRERRKIEDGGQERRVKDQLYSNTIVIC